MLKIEQTINFNNEIFRINDLVEITTEDGAIKGRLSRLRGITAYVDASEPYKALSKKILDREIKNIKHLEE